MAKRPSPIKRILYGIGALACTWAGLGMLGVVSGWHNTDTATAKVFGVALLIAGFTLVRTVIDPGPPPPESPDATNDDSAPDAPKDNPPADKE